MSWKLRAMRSAILALAALTITNSQSLGQTVPGVTPGARPGFVSREGFVDAMVMGPKRAGKDLTRDGLIRAIESIHQMDLGLGPQMKPDYSSRSHAGLEGAIPTVIRGRRGAIHRLGDG